MLIGNVGRDPEVRYLEGNNGAKVATFTLATTERYRDRNGETRENTEWHNIVAWRNTADVVERFVRKGTQLYIEGRIRTRSWMTRPATNAILPRSSLIHFSCSERSLTILEVRADISLRASRDTSSLHRAAISRLSQLTSSRHMLSLRHSHSNRLPLRI